MSPERRALHTLIDRARRSGPSTRSLEGDAGWVAEIEPSPDGRARRIVARRPGSPAETQVVVEAGAARPPFYPDGVPFLPEVAAVATGEMISWTVQHTPDVAEALRDAVAGVEDWDLPDDLRSVAGIDRHASAEDRRAAVETARRAEVPDSMHQLMGVMRGMIARRSDEPDDPRWHDVVAYHTSAGWSMERWTGSPSGLRFHRNGEERYLQILAVSTSRQIVLWLRPPGRRVMEGA